MSDIRLWLGNSVANEQGRMGTSTDPTDQAFYEGMVDAYKLVVRFLDTEHSDGTTK